MKIEWSHPRLILIAESFSDYDKYAVNRIGANVELWTYRLYGQDLLYLEPLFVTETKPTKTVTKPIVSKDQPAEQVEGAAEAPSYTIDDHLSGKPRSSIITLLTPPTMGARGHFHPGLFSSR